MFVRSILLAVLAAVASAKAIVPDFEVSADSKLGKRLLSKARALENNDRDMTFVAKYSVKYTGCASLVSLSQEGNNNNEGGILQTQNLAKFSLCPTDGECGSCKSGADYVINMMDFMDAWTEFKMTAEEYACESIRENCYCNNMYNDDQLCENYCYTQAEMTQCIEAEGEEQFELQRYLECAGKWLLAGWRSALELSMPTHIRSVVLFSLQRWKTKTATITIITTITTTAGTYTDEIFLLIAGPELTTRRLLFPVGTDSTTLAPTAVPMDTPSTWESSMIKVAPLMLMWENMPKPTMELPCHTLTLLSSPRMSASLVWKLTKTVSKVPAGAWFSSTCPLDNSF
jgi:hypothetical protein